MSTSSASGEVIPGSHHTFTQLVNNGGTSAFASFRRRKPAAPVRVRVMRCGVTCWWQSQSTSSRIDSRDSLDDSALEAARTQDVVHDDMADADDASQTSSSNADGPPVVRCVV
jgi:hypothetical protein